MTTRLAALAFACALTVARVGGQSAVTLLPTPAGADSGMYSLATAADGRTYLVWIEPVASGGHALKFSRLEGDAWQAPVQIAQGANWFVNWADHPTLTATAEGRLFVHWLVNTGKKSGSYGYGIRVATSTDRGATWTTAFEEGFQNVSDYSGFLSFLPTARGVDAVYLTPLHPDDGSGEEHEHVKTVGIAQFGPDGTEIGRQIVDRDACSCCSTDIAETAAGPIAVYRDHEAGEIRDISIVRRVNGTWTTPAAVPRDGWKIGGCPTNGPAVAARGRTVVVAWFTAANDRPQVKAVFSSDAGATFSAPVVVAEGAPVGWADVVLLDDGRALVSWLERTADGVGDIRLRAVTKDGRQPAITVATSSSGRATGIPMLARAGRDVIVAWRQGQVRTARVAVPPVAGSRR
ncbi:MAG: exo-alpha-sialidase [Acidobacteria bacterium]|nr:exo-alpha-sialidase [Acidobacteriota bacterium]